MSSEPFYFLREGENYDAVLVFTDETLERFIEVLKTLRPGNFRPLYFTNERVMAIKVEHTKEYCIKQEMPNNKLPTEKLNKEQQKKVKDLLIPGKGNITSVKALQNLINALSEVPLDH